MRNRLLGLFAVAVLGVVLVVVLRGGSDDSTHYSYTTPTKLGDLIPVAQRKPAKDFSGQLLSGGTTSLKASAGKVALVNFWATWCGPCTVETPQFDALYRTVRAKDVAFYGIDTLDQRSLAKNFVADNDISYPIVFDQQGQTLITLGNFPNKLPFTVLIDKQGRVAAVYIIRLTVKDLRPPLDALLAET